MDDDDFEAWKLCWHANLLFHKLVTNLQKCIVCSEIYSYVGDTRRSSFWLEGTRCSVGHRQATQTETQGTPSLGVCATCDQRYMLDVVKGKHICRRNSCRRIVRIHEAEAKAKLACDKVLLKNFLSLVRKFRVYECAVHCDEVTYDSNPYLAFKPPTAQCDHDRNVCDACLKTTFEGAIRGGRLQDLVCLDPECKKPISLEMIRQTVSAEVFKIYNKQLALKTISQDKQFRWCACGHGQIHGPGESSPEWHCLSCKTRHCYICREESSEICQHLRSIDEQKQTRKVQQKQAALRILQQARENEAATRSEIARITKKCPKVGCGNKIERNDGCGHFTCRKCKTEFCWCCKVIWKDKRVLHLTGCKIGFKSTVAMGSLDTTGYAVGWNKDEGYDLTLDKGLFLIDSQQ